MAESSRDIYAQCVIPVTADPLRFSTVGLPEDQRIALWEDHNAQALIAVRCRSLQDATLEATEINVALPRLQLARVLGNPHIVERTGQTVRQTPSTPSRATSRSPVRRFSITTTACARCRRAR